MSGRARTQVEAASPQRLLATRLCPWLAEPLRRIEAASAGGRLGHAWLITGPRGTGKINLARVLAERLLNAAATEDPPLLSAADVAAAMRERHLPADHHPDLHWVFPEEDKHSISVDQIRAVGEVLALKAYAGAAKVVVVEPADAMTIAAANSLLKTLEEPPLGTYLLLVTHRPERLPATVRSRCQHIPVAAPEATALEAWLDGPAGEELQDLWLLAGGAPVTMAELASTDNWNIVKRLDSDLLSISQDKADPQAVAEGWIKTGAERVLVWLNGRIAGAVRARAMGDDTTPVTDARPTTLHNAWRNLTLAKLIDQHRRAETLQNQLGSGLNLELALRVLLIDFRTHRGES